MDLFRGGIFNLIYSGMNCGAIVTTYSAVLNLPLVDAAITVPAMMMMMLIIYRAMTCYPREVVIAET
jgi:hypothetical protein